MKQSNGILFVSARQPTLARRLAILCVLLLGATLTAGCFRTEPAPTGEPQLLNTLPAGWTPITFGRSGIFSRSTTWQPINIDDDLPTEFLLFFTYDNGQVGAAIYDQQTGSTGVVSATPMPAPNQPTGTFIPYRVEPSFWSGSGSVGFIAPPGTDSGTIRFSQVQRPPSAAAPQPTVAPATEPAGEGAPTAVPTIPAENPTGNNELNIFGGPTVLSVVWWRNTFNGYGITQITAEGGLKPTYQDNNTEGAILSVIALEPIRRAPLHRSYLCRELKYERTPAAEPPGIVEPVFQRSFQFTPEDRGIAFCSSPPDFPFYPEGVVMAYLRPENPSNPDQTEATIAAYRNQFIASTVDEAARASFLALIDFDGPDNQTIPSVVVEDLETPPFIPLTPDYRTPTGGPLTTSVCAQIGSTDGLPSRRLLFQMIYAPPTQVTADGQMTVTGDRFYIGNVADVTAVGINCLAVITPSVMEGATPP
jgi:hypothetical protein